jgi:hypothetical protein
MGYPLVEEVIPTVKKTVTKLQLRRWPRFSKNSIAVGVGKNVLNLTKHFCNHNTKLKICIYV